MYDHIFDAALATTLLALCLVWLAATLAGRPGFAVRVVAFSFAPAFAAAFFVVAPFAHTAVSMPDILAGLLFEFVVLCLFCRMFVSIFGQVQRLDLAATRRAMFVSLVLQAAMAIPIVTSEGFGIFSEGSRIEYLYAGSSAKYFTYAGILLTVLQAGLLARRISGAGRPRGLDYVILAVNFGLSLLSGSKGAFFLWLLGSLALVDYRAARIRRGVAFGAFLVVAAAFVWMVQVISGFLGLTFEEFLTLAVNRVFLSNDARALAFDLRPLVQPGDGLFSESFRSLSTMFGYPPSNPPLGVHFYEHYFGVSDGNGANASLAALIVFYSVPGYALFPALLAIVAALMLYATIGAVQRALQGTVARFAATAWGAIALQQLSQDFLAFQVVLPLVVLAVMILFVIDRGTALASRPSARHRAAPLAQHRHSGARA